jgi:hypothetical protein
MTKINNINFHTRSLSIELGFYNRLQNVDTISNTVTIVSDKNIETLPISKVESVTFIPEKQIVQTVR